MSDDEITLKEAAEIANKKHPRPWLLPSPTDDDEMAARKKRERETGEATAALDAMLSASRAGKRVTK